MKREEKIYYGELTPTGELVLREAGLQALPKKILHDVRESLLHIDLQDNQISYLDGDVLLSLPHLRSIDLRTNKIENLPSEITQLGKLKSLRVDNNLITTLPNNVQDFLSLEVFTLQGNKIQNLPSSLGKIRTLHTIILSNNLLKSLPDQFGDLTNLRIAHLHGNSFSTFPVSLMNLINLKEFSLEWFKYTNPPLPKVLKGHMGEAMIDSLRNLCGALKKINQKDCALIAFLEHYSEKIFKIDKVDGKNRSLLHNAAQQGDCGVIEGFIRAKADINSLDKDGYTPLCLALRNDNFQAVKILLDNSADINTGGGLLGSPLHMATIKSEIWLVKDFIIKYGANVNLVDGEGNTPLHLVMSIFSRNPKNCIAIVETLLQAGALPNAENKDLWTPLHLASRKGQDEGVSWMIQYNQTTKGIKFDLNKLGGTHN